MKEQMKTVSVKQIQSLDKVAIKHYGVPSIALMENAGRHVADVVMKKLRRVKRPHVVIFCGLGNNAGDGFVTARHLINAHVKVKIYLIGEGRRLKQDAAVHYAVLKKLKYPIKEIKRISKPVISDIIQADAVIDALFGVGLNRVVEDPFKGVIESINEHGEYVISIDSPSGLDGTTGEIYGVCIRANKTVTFSFAKKGFFKNFGPRYAGNVVTVDIGIPEKLKKRLSFKEFS